MFDKSVETAVEWTFHNAFRTFGGPDAVGHAAETGREAELQRDSRRAVAKEKEL